MTFENTIKYKQLVQPFQGHLISALIEVNHSPIYQIFADVAIAFSIHQQAISPFFQAMRFLFEESLFFSYTNEFLL